MKWLSGEDGMKVRGWDFQLHQVLAKSLQTSNAWFPPPSFERRTIYCLKHQVVSEWSHLRIILSSHFHCIDETFAQNRQISKVAGRVDWEGWHPIKDYKVTTRWEGPQSLSYHQCSMSKEGTAKNYIRSRVQHEVILEIGCSTRLY